MSGAKLHGPSNSTPGATFEQNYPEIEWRKTKGSATGTWNPPDGASSTYKFKWKVKGHQWCEDWGSSGSECFTIVPLVGDRYDFIKANGEHITAEWRIDSPRTGPLRLNGEQLAADTNRKYTGNWQYSGSGSARSGTFETHYCDDGTRIYSVEGGDFETTTWSVKDDKTCYAHPDGERCFELWQMADGSRASYRKTKSGKVTSQTTSIEESDRCPA
jgi:hypothetical protein